MREWYHCNYSKSEKVLGRWKETSEWHLAQGQTRQPWPSQATAWIRQARHLTLEMGSRAPRALRSRPPLWAGIPVDTTWEVQEVAQGTSRHPPRGEETHFGGGRESRALPSCCSSHFFAPPTFLFPIWEGWRVEHCHRRLKLSLTQDHKLDTQTPTWCANIRVFFRNIAVGEAHSLELHPWILLEIPVSKSTSSPSAWITGGPFWVSY